MPNLRRYDTWGVIERCADLPGAWVAHSLDLDVVTQGRSLREAMDMLAEAALMVVTDELSRGRDPHDRRAPAKYWKRLWSITNSTL